VPELPEVEVVRAGLSRHVVGAKVTTVEVLHPRPVRRDPRGPAGFASALTGRRIEAARRRGKYLWLPLDNGDALLGHLGMSGQLLVQRPDAAPERHLRVRIGLDGSADGRPSETARSLRDGLLRPPPQDTGSPPQDKELRFVDQRMFGGLSISAGGAELPAEIAHIARDPLDPGFDDEEFVAKVRRRTSGIKRQLLDQNLVSGVGNIYADEALWRARLHGERSGERLTRPQVRELLGHVRDVMNEALGQGGTSFDALYVDVNGESGYFGRALHAYGREGEPCDRCGAPLRRVAFMNRSSHFCPVCQPVPRRRRALPPRVAVTE
jgi:formamidopyrimidine-DNA glycosylase